MDQTEQDIFFMKEALKEAKKAFDREEVPVGAVLVFDQKVIARGYNQVELLNDATAHAEMIAITVGASFLSNWRLTEATLYCTLEPCSMCAGAIINSRIQRVVYGAPDIRQGAHGSWVNLFDQNHPIHSLEIKGGVLKEQCAELMTLFFQTQREKSKNGNKNSVHRTASSRVD